MEAVQRAAVPILQVEIPMMTASASSPDPSMEAVAATWEVHRLWEILPTASRVPCYSKKPVTQKRSSHACLIIEILA
jgi:K+-transporting ATPase c subunit